jgi:hypothetical protein
MRVLKYEAFLVDQAGSNQLSAAGANYGVATPPFGLANVRHALPLINEFGTNYVATAGTRSSNGVLAWTGSLVGAVIDDWLEFDDAVGDGVLFTDCLVNSTWYVFNSSAGALNASVLERMTYETWVLDAERGPRARHEEFEGHRY